MSSPAEPSPKRQRRSYSPASPPTHSETKSGGLPPQTPPPSVHMSPSWQPQPTAAHHPGSTAGSTTFPTPPSTAGPHSQHTMGDSGGSEMGVESGHQTPMEDRENVSSMKRDGDGDEDMREGQNAGEQPSGSSADIGHRRTDHEREGSHGDAARQSPSVMQGLYTTCTQPIAPSAPHATADFIGLYGLERIQASVARKDAAGNKINKLRKSYENKVKHLGLEGRSKAQIGNAALQGLVDPGWDMDIGNGMTAWQARTQEMPLNGPSVDDVMSKLGSALDFAPGHLPSKEHEGWKNILGLDGSGAKTTPTSLKPTKPQGTAAFAGRPDQSGAMRSSAPASPRQGHRPDRAGKKRRYDESSYSGYHEGFDDDGYATGGLDDAGSRRNSGFKRQKMHQRKDFSPASSPPYSSADKSSPIGVHSS